MVSSGPLSLPHPFMSFAETKLGTVMEDGDIQDMEMDELEEDRYGIKDQNEAYVGVREGPRKKANNFARAKDIKVQTFLVMRAPEEDADAFCIPGSQVPLWLAYVHGITAGDKDTELTVSWYVPSDSTPKIQGYFPADKMFYKYVPKAEKRKGDKPVLPTGQETLKVTNSELVVINIDKLNGGKKNQGHIPARKLKDIAKVLLPTRLEKRLTTCPNCVKNPKSGNSVECVECGQVYHEACVGHNGIPGSRWLCNECELEEMCE
jgi:hypothetical protein